MSAKMKMVRQGIEALMAEAIKVKGASLVTSLITIASPIWKCSHVKHSRPATMPNVTSQRCFRMWPVMLIAIPIISTMAGATLICEVTYTSSGRKRGPIIPQIMAMTKNPIAKMPNVCHVLATSVPTMLSGLCFVFPAIEQAADGEEDDEEGDDEGPYVGHS